MRLGELIQELVARQFTRSSAVGDEGNMLSKKCSIPSDRRQDSYAPLAFYC